MSAWFSLAMLFLTGAFADTYPSSAPAMFALEVRQGWFAEHGIAVGAQPSIVFGVQKR